MSLRLRFHSVSPDRVSHTHATLHFHTHTDAFFSRRLVALSSIHTTVPPPPLILGVLTGRSIRVEKGLKDLKGQKGSGGFA